MTRARKIQILNEVLNGNPDALAALNEDSFYMNMNDTSYYKDGVSITKVQFDKETKNANVPVLKIELVGQRMPPLTSEKEAEAFFDRQQTAINQASQ